jgi:hypothetical protein
MSFSFDRIMTTRQVHRASQTYPMKSLEIVDDYGEITLNAPYGPFLTVGVVDDFAKRPAMDITKTPIGQAPLPLLNG